MPAEYILNLLLILNLACWTTLLPLAPWKQAGSAPLRPQPQYKQSMWNSSSQCTTDSKCLEKEVLKITQCNKISGRKAPGSMFAPFFWLLYQIKIIVGEARPKLRKGGGGLCVLRAAHDWEMLFLCFKLSHESTLKSENLNLMTEWAVYLP